MSPLGTANVDELRKSDERARALAQRVFDRPVILEAGAGTGKTTALVARVLSWCLGVGWDRAVTAIAGDAEGIDQVASTVLGGVVAITFTEKAAAEMSQRQSQWQKEQAPLLESQLENLSGLRGRQEQQLEMKLKDSKEIEGVIRNKRERRMKQIDDAFKSYESWVRDTMTIEPSPWLQIIAAFTSDRG